MSCFPSSILTATQSAKCVMADLILIWRAWVLCNRSWKAVVVPTCSLVGTISTSVLAVCMAHSFDQYMLVCGGGLLHNGAQTNSSHASFNEVFSSKLNSWELSFAAFVFITNIIATSLIAGRIWHVVVLLIGYP